MEFGIGQDRRARDLVEGDVLRREIGRGGDDQRVADALRVADRPGERLHPAEAPAHHRGEPLDAEVVGEARLGIDPIFDRDDGKIGAPRLSGRGVDRRRPGRAEAAAEIIDTDRKKTRRVDRLARTHHIVPPPLACRLAGVFPGDVVRRVERVADEDRVGAFGIERAIRLVHQFERRQRGARRESERVAEGRSLRLHDADGARRCGHEVPSKKPDQLALIGSVNWEKQPRRFSRICRKSGIAGLPSRPQADRQIGASRLVYRRAARCQFQRHRSTIRG